MSPLVKSGVRAAIAAICYIIAFPHSVQASADAIRRNDRAIWGAFGYSFYNYKEPLSSPYIPDSDRGWLPSFSWGASIRTPRDLYLAAEGSVTYGDTIYRGAYLNNPSTPLKATTGNTIWTGAARIGQGFELADTMLTPYVELGFRHWDRDFGDGGVENYENFSILGGLMVQYAPIESLVFTAYGSAGTTFLPTLHYAPYTYDMASAGMYKAGIKLGYAFLPRAEIFAAFDYNFFRFLESNTAPDGTYEPDSRTSETMVRVGIAYHY
ncbi:MAG: hypothetical protein PHW76_06935 [Alphaproteobacteria bacterium]|nr:hypothetical protein [Alphaproteobacteria bacterium]